MRTTSAAEYSVASSSFRASADSDFASIQGCRSTMYLSTTEIRFQTASSAREKSKRSISVERHLGGLRGSLGDVAIAVGFGNRRRHDTD